MNFSAALSSMVWSTHYANPFCDKELNKVITDDKMLKWLEQIILDSCGSIESVMVAQSHVHIYDFIKNNYDPTLYDRLEVANIDMHHDLFNDNKKLDCGNWVSHLFNLYGKNNVGVSWICNPVSKELYGLSEDRFKFIDTGFGKIENIDFDALFLCRSDIWTPPHLDAKFDELFGFLKDTFCRVMYDKQIETPRDIEVDVKTQREFYNQVLELNKGKK